MTTPHPELIDVFTDCGCLVGITYTGKSTPNLATEVMRCPLHETARVMLATLRKVAALFELDYGEPFLYFGRQGDEVSEAVDAAIAAATKGADANATP